MKVINVLRAYNDALDEKNNSRGNAVNVNVQDTNPNALVQLARFIVENTEQVNQGLLEKFFNL